MTREQYHLLESYMRQSMDDGAHGTDHVYRVLYIAMDIAAAEENVDADVLVAACLLHDIARREQGQGLVKCHAAAGAEKARAFLLSHGWDEAFAEKVAHAIRTHRFSVKRPPESVEAKILFDADKVDVTGLMGVARTLQYGGEMGEPLYTLGSDGLPAPGAVEDAPSFFQEYKRKLERLYDRFYTARGLALARERQKAAEAFRDALWAEVDKAYRGLALVEAALEENP